jgi:stearoyl-CoA desaturase (delta-9 desaturase)
VDGAVIQASNVAIMAIPTMGESWHGNHHAFPSSARHGLYPGQIDLGYRFVQLLEALGLVWNVKLPANLPPRQGITPLTERALTVVSEQQAAASNFSRQVRS